MNEDIQLVQSGSYLHYKLQEVPLPRQVYFRLYSANKLAHPIRCRHFPNFQVVVAFRMLPEVVWKMPKLGTFNLHASLLPEYRGAAPINWAIINGETKTGVTSFFIDDKIDTGAMILSKETEIGANETAGELHDRLMHLGSETVLETLELIEAGKATTTLQENNPDVKTAYKLNKENCKIINKQLSNQVLFYISHTDAF
jgi:methionyl-tRNA formyltransferase